jgi:RimJ/RimL family protein N-acetyltransferase
MINGAVLETDRLQLRKLTLDDAGLMLAVWNDPAFIRHVVDRGIHTTGDAHEAMRKGALHLYEAHGYGPYPMALKDGDTPIGICGLFRRDGLDEPDIGYSTLPDFCGEGYAFEAATAVLDYAHAELALERLIAIISPGNDASIGLIRKLGFEFERMHTMPDDEDEVCIYGKSLIG